MNGFDTRKLAAAVNRKIEDSGISASVAAREIGISNSTFYRIKNGTNCPDSNNLLPICKWLNEPFERFTTGESEKVTFYESGETLDKIEALIEADSTLTRSDRRKLIEIFRAQYKVLTSLAK